MHNNSSTHGRFCDIITNTEGATRNINFKMPITVYKRRKCSHTSISFPQHNVSGGITDACTDGQQLNLSRWNKIRINNKCVCFICVSTSWHTVMIENVMVELLSKARNTLIMVCEFHVSCSRSY